MTPLKFHSLNFLNLLGVAPVMLICPGLHLGTFGVELKTGSEAGSATTNGDAAAAAPETHAVSKRDRTKCNKKFLVAGGVTAAMLAVNAGQQLQVQALASAGPLGLCAPESQSLGLPEVQVPSSMISDNVIPDLTLGQFQPQDLKAMLQGLDFTGKIAKILASNPESWKGSLRHESIFIPKSFGLFDTGLNQARFTLKFRPDGTRSENFGEDSRLFSTLTAKFLRNADRNGGNTKSIKLTVQRDWYVEKLQTDNDLDYQQSSEKFREAELRQIFKNPSEVRETLKASGDNGISNRIGEFKPWADDIERWLERDLRQVEENERKGLGERVVRKASEMLDGLKEKVRARVC